MCSKLHTTPFMRAKNKTIISRVLKIHTIIMVTTSIKSGSPHKTCSTF